MVLMKIMAMDFAITLDTQYTLILALIGKDLGGTRHFFMVLLLNHQKYQKTLWTGIIVMHKQQAGLTARIQPYLDRLFKGRFVFIIAMTITSVLGHLTSK